MSMIAVFTTLLAWALASILASILLARTARLGPRVDRFQRMTLDDAAQRAGVDLNGASFDELNRLGHLIGIHTGQVNEPASPIGLRAATRDVERETDSLSPVTDDSSGSRAA